MNGSRARREIAWRGASQDVGHVPVTPLGHGGRRRPPVAQSRGHGNGDIYTRYVRTKNRTEGPNGCGKLARKIEPVDYLVSEAVLTRLDSPELAKLLNG